eukprot:5940199-Pleurochrysis_carterae.AAC.1
MAVLAALALLAGVASFLTASPTTFEFTSTQLPPLLVCPQPEKEVEETSEKEDSLSLLLPPCAS